jgi:hypothetical protein
MITWDEFMAMRLALEQSEGARLDSDLDALERSLGVFRSNCEDLLDYLNPLHDIAAVLELWDIKNREGFDRFLDEVTRRLHNVVAAATSLRDNYYRVRKKWLKPDPADDLASNYADTVKEVFEKSRTARLVVGLRNITQHRKLPRLGGVLQASPGEPHKSEITLDSRDLLEWDGWSSEMRSFIEEEGDYITLDEIVVEYRDAVVAFHAWFGDALRRRNASALQDLDQARRKLSELAHELSAVVDDPDGPTPLEGGP